MVRFGVGDCVWEDFFVKDRLNMGQILRLRRQNPSPLRMTIWKDGVHER